MCGKSWRNTAITLECDFGAPTHRRVKNAETLTIWFAETNSASDDSVVTVVKHGSNDYEGDKDSATMTMVR